MADKGEPYGPYTAATLKPPQRDCPKCGDPKAFSTRLVRFVPLTYGRGLMRWECRTCGYILIGKPLDEETV